MRPNDRKLSASQPAMFSVFLIVGHAMLSPIAWFPLFIERLGVNFAQWGTILGFSALGAILPLVFSSRILLHLGSRAVLRVALLSAMIFLVSLGLWESPVFWTTAHTGFTLSMSLVGISMNTHAVVIQSFIARPVVARLHAGWSVGALIAAFSGAFSTVFLSVEVALLAVAALTVGLFEMLRSHLLSPDEDGHEADKASHRKTGPRKIPGVLWILIAGLFAALFPEIAIFEWSVVFARDVLAADLALRVFPFASFMVGMILGRFLAPLLLSRIRAHLLASIGSAIAAIFLTISIFFPASLADGRGLDALTVTAFVWLATGLGLSGLAPAYFAAAAHVPLVSMAWALSFMQLITQVLLVGAKALMGFIAEGFGVDMAFLFPVIVLAVGSIIALRNPSLVSVERQTAAHI